MPRPPSQGRRVRIRYMTQRKARPPSFTLFGNQLDALPEAYLRYLQNGLRESFRPEGHAAALQRAQLEESVCGEEVADCHSRPSARACEGTQVRR